MNVWLLCTSHWDGPEDPRLVMLEDWRRRTDHIECVDRCISTGTASPAYLAPLGVNLVDIGLPRTVAYSNAWSYWRAALHAGITHALIHHRRWDILLHVQDRTMLGEDLNPVLEEFAGRPEAMMAPKWTSILMEAPCPEMGLMALKKEGAHALLTRAMRPSLGDPHNLVVEDEALRLLGGSWWDPWPDVHTLRFYDVISPHIPSRYTDDASFLHLPHIASGKHCPPGLGRAWKLDHPPISAR